MVSFINNALKHRNGEKGFSLVELIVVVAILGILVVIAIPVFGAIQETARVNTVKTAAANAATSIAAAVTSNPGSVADTLEKLNAQGDEIKYALAPTPGSFSGGWAGFPGVTITNPVTASNDSTDTVYVYAVNKNKNWAGAGSAGTASNGKVN